MHKLKELPRGWKECAFEEISDKNHKYPIGDGDHGQIKPNTYQAKGIPYIRVADIVDDRIVKDKLVFISEEVHNANPKSHLFPDDIIIAKTGATIGKVAIIPGWMKTANTTSSVGKITIDKKIVIPKFLYHYLRTPLFKSQMWRVSNKSAQAGFNVIDLKKFTIHVPQLEIQKKIVAILERAEELKRKREQANQLTNKILQSVFLKMFGDPATNPKGLKFATLNEICHYIKDGPHVSPQYTTDGVPFISVHNIVNGYFDLSDVRYISIEDHRKYSRKCKPEKGDVLYSKGGTTGIARRVDVDYEFSIWVHLALLKIKRDMVNAEYLETMLNSEFCKVQAKALTRGIANKDLVLGQMKQIRIILPPLSLQQEFAKIVERIEVIRKKQVQSCKEINEVFNSLMSEAFKGELVKEQMMHLQK